MTDPQSSRSSTESSPITGPASERRSLALPTVGIFLFSAILAGATVAGPGLSWDEPAYRHSQVTLQQWFRELANAPDANRFWSLFSPESIDRYWEYNRPGHNFHPPMGGLLNLATYSATSWWIDDISSRRMASALEFALSAALLFLFAARRWGLTVGVFSALSLVTMPRLMGDAHVIGTDMPLMLFWGAATIAFEAGLRSRWCQLAFALLWSCLFLVKFSGLVLAGPLGLWFLLTVLVRQPWKRIVRWCAWSAILIVPLIPVGSALLLGGGPADSPWARRLSLLIQLGMSPWMGLVLFWPILGWILFQVRKNRSNADPAWPVGLEIPWVTLAVAPLATIAFNPTWWHDPIPSLARFFDLNLHRRGYLPDIGIFYLGERYLYSLPWHNAFVLMGVTIPWGALLFGLVGVGVAIARCRKDSAGAFLLLNALALPVFRMLPTPAHDGVRLFLPTFFFWAGLAGLGAQAFVGRAGRTGVLNRLAWGIAFVVGPAWAGVEWLRCHPFELSYYNIGLARAVDAGFEATYWYDAVTPRTLAEINDRLPPSSAVGFPDRLINPETFVALQQLGRLRGDINLGGERAEGFTSIWLLTHSSKSTAFTRLLFACPPWLECRHAGVRLFSVVDPNSVALAWMLHTLIVEFDRTSSYDPRSNKPRPLRLYEPILQMPPDSVRTAMTLLHRYRGDARAHLAGQPADVVDLVQRFTQDGRLDSNLAKVFDHQPDAVEWAIRILADRKEDVRQIVLCPGYLLPERFGGPLVVP